LHRSHLMAFVILFIMLVASCNGQDKDAKFGEGARVTESGFPCPEPVLDWDGISTQLNLYLPEESVPPKIIECFGILYGIHISIDTFGHPEQMYAKLSASGKRYDLAISRDMYVPLLADQGLLKKMDKGRLPMFHNIDPNYLGLDFDPLNQYSIPWRAGTTAIAVNAAAVKTIPTSWADLWNDEYSGRLIYQNDLRMTIGAVLLSLGYDVNTTNPDELAHAKDKLAELFPLAGRVSSLDAGVSIVDGEADLGMMLSNEIVKTQRHLSTLRYIIPSEGVILWQDNWVLLEESPNTDAAYAFLNYAMQADVSWLLLRGGDYTSPNAMSIAYARENRPNLYYEYMVDSPVANIPLVVLQNGHRIMDVGKATSIYDDIWVDVIVGN